MNEYEKQAQDFLTKFHITFSCEYLGSDEKWRSLRPHYQITLTRPYKKDVKSWSFDFWGSHVNFKDGVKEASPYDVLACISGNEIYYTRRDITDNFGHDLSGIDVKGLLQEAKCIREFFTKAALNALHDIQ